MEAKIGPKLKASVVPPSADALPPGTPDPERYTFTGGPALDHDEQGFPVLPPGRPARAMRLGPGTLIHLKARQQPISRLAEMLSLYAGRWVIDKTGLTGEYDFTLYYDMQTAGAPPAADDGPVPILLDALPQQLGLRLVEGNAPFNVIVVDHAEKVPTDN